MGDRTVGKKKMRLTTQAKIFLVVMALVLVALMLVSGWVAMNVRLWQSLHAQARGELADVRQELHEQADAFLVQTAKYVANTLESCDKATDAQLQELLKRFEVSEIHLVDTNGIIVKSTVPADRGFKMASGAQSAEFMSLLHGVDFYAQPLRAKSNGGKLARYAAAVFPAGGGFAQIGLDQQAFLQSLAQRVRGIARNRHLRSSGYVLLATARGQVISAPAERVGVVGCNLDAVTGESIAKWPRDHLFRAKLIDEDAFCYFSEVDGFSALVVQPSRELLVQQFVVFGSVSGVSLVALILIMVLANLAFHRLVTNPVSQMAEALNRIVGGDYDAVADVRTSAEFESLSDNVNAAAAALKEHARVERERLQRERDQVVEADKAKTLFFSTVSHDIRTPLNAIVGFSELLEAGDVPPEEVKRDLAMIRTSGRTLLELVNDLLDLSKLEAGKMEICPEPTDVRNLVAEILPVFGPQIGERHQTLVSEVPELPSLMVDPHRIRQILFNLIGNAVKYAGSCTIRVSAAYTGGPRSVAAADATERVPPNGGVFTLTVSDNGVGLDADMCEKVMQPYSQAHTSNSRCGTGLGLAVCRQLAKCMGGTFTLKAAPGMGCTFTLAIPAREVECSKLKVEKSGDVQPSTFNVQPATRILVADDAPMNRTVLKAMLKSLGITDVTLVENGRQALAELERSANFDWVLTDMWMPEMDGMELVKRIRADAKLASLKVCTITADVEARNTYREQGFDALLLKPITRAGLRDLLA